MLEAKKIGKQYGRTKALDHVDLVMQQGEIRALLGANGSGKSTIAKVLGGLVSKDSGNIVLDGTQIEIRSAADALNYGISLAYQDYSLVDELTVEQNLFLNIPITKMHGFIDFKKRKQITEDILKRFEIEAEPYTYVGELEESFKSLLEVAKALNYKPQYLILDEVTACLHRDQVQLLFEILKNEKEKGTAILFISHRLDEIFELCNTVTIFRNGQMVKETEICEVNEDDIVYYMTGERAEGRKSAVRDTVLHDKKPILSAKNISVGNQMRSVSLNLYPGEIIGICGLQGQGQSEFLRAVYGYMRFEAGELEIEGKNYQHLTPKKALKLGIGFISGDRKSEGIFPDRSIFENISIQKISQKPLFAGIGYAHRTEEVKSMTERLKIVFSNARQNANSLSGGNQQKLLVARNLLLPLKVLLLDDPTKGVDIHARNEIQEILRNLARKGLGCIYYSSDYKELTGIADRVVVFYEGKIIKELNSNTQELESEIAAAMLGAGKEGVKG